MKDASVGLKAKGRAKEELYVDRSQDSRKRERGLQRVGKAPGGSSTGAGPPGSKTSIEERE